MRTGIKTTEFWLTLSSIVLGVVDQQLGLNLPKESIFGVVAYILGRAWTKGQAAKAGQ